MSDSITTFLTYLEVEKRSSPHTVKAYAADLDQFLKWLRFGYDLEKPEQADPPMIRDWIMDMSEEGLDARTINRKLSSLRTFYTFLVRAGQVSDSPMRSIRSMKTSKRVVRPVEEEAMERLLGRDLYDEEDEPIRDRTIMILFYTTGMRRSELIKMEWRDVDWSGRRLRVLGKRNVERVIPLTDIALEILEEWRRKIGRAEGLIFLSDAGNKLSEKLVYNRVVHYLSKVSSVEKKSPHVLRHTFATHLLNMGADLQTIKELLGHASLAATQIYTQSSIDQIKSVYNDSHPRNHKK